MFRKKNDSRIPDTKELTAELRGISEQLKDAYVRFDYAAEPELVEACTYEISALKARYDYLLRRIKTGGAREYPRPYAVPDGPNTSKSVACAASGMKGGPSCLS